MPIFQFSSKKIVKIFPKNPIFSLGRYRDMIHLLFERIKSPRSSFNREGLYMSFGAVQTFYPFSICVVPRKLSPVVDIFFLMTPFITTAEMLSGEPDSRIRFCLKHL